MEIEIFTSCSRFEVHPEHGPTLYGFGPTIFLPCQPDEFVVTILLAAVFDENDWEARKVSLQIYDDDEDMLASTNGGVLRPSEVIHRGERRTQSWELPGRLFYQPGYYEVALLVDGVETRRITIGAALRPPATEEGS